MLILWAHALAALLFGALALSQARVRGQRAFAAALAVTTLWALAVAGTDPGGVMLPIVEAARDTAWLLAMLLFVRREARLGVGIGAVYAAVATIACAAAVLGIIEAMPAAAAAAEALSSVRALFRMLAAVAVPCVVVLALRMAPQPMKPVPVIRPSRIRACPSEHSPSTSIASIMKPQLASATMGEVHRPALLVPCSRFQAIGKVNRKARAMRTR